MADRLFAAGYTLLAAGNRKGPKGCWETNDVETVTALLHAWRRKHVRSSTPLFLNGPSSGGFFATEAARHWRDVRGLSVQISVPTLDQVRPPLPSRAASYPPLQLILCQRDSGKWKDAEALKAVLPPFELLNVLPKRVDDTFFSSAIPGLDPVLSARVRDALVAAGHIDNATFMVRKHPSRSSWRDPVLAALNSGKHRLLASSKAKKGSSSGPPLQEVMDGIFARLDLAYAYHASTCEHVDKTIAFFQRVVENG